MRSRKIADVSSELIERRKKENKEKEREGRR
jgi:hypothetical protein